MKEFLIAGIAPESEQDFVLAVKGLVPSNRYVRQFSLTILRSPDGHKRNADSVDLYVMMGYKTQGNAVFICFYNEPETENLYLVKAIIGLHSRRGRVTLHKVLYINDDCGHS